MYYITTVVKDEEATLCSFKDIIAFKHIFATAFWDIIEFTNLEEAILFARLHFKFNKNIEFKLETENIWNDKKSWRAVILVMVDNNVFCKIKQFS
jgi:hypothetical protein